MLLPVLTASAAETLHIDRAGRMLYVLDDSGQVTRSEPVGVGRGGLSDKRTMADLITPTGRFTVDLILTEAGGEVAQEAIDRFAGEPAYAALLTGEPGLPGLFANMSRIDFDADGAPDGAYGSAYIGLTSSEAVTGPKLRRYRDGTLYWFSIALHGTPDPANIGAANSGGCVHLAAPLLADLIDGEIVAIGSPVVIADGPP